MDRAEIVTEPVSDGIGGAHLIEIMMGDQSEQWTAQELRHLRRPGWKVINDVGLKRWNTDHVIVGPGGVYAIESEWSTSGLSVAPPDVSVSAGCRRVVSAPRDTGLVRQESRMSP